MNVFDTLFPRRTSRPSPRAAARRLEGRRRSRLAVAAHAEQLERRNPMAIDVIMKSPGQFFIDESNATVLNSQYVSYKVEYSGVSYDDVWLKLSADNDPGEVLRRAQYEDGLYNLGRLQGTGTAMAYLYFSASTTTNTPQVHTITVYDGNPDDPTVPSTAIFSNNSYTFDSIENVVLASASKITSITLSEIPPGQVPLGSTMTMTVLGQLGQANKVLFSPALRNDWKPDAYVLEQTLFTIDGATKPADEIFFDDLDGSNEQQPVKAVYTFRIADVTGPTVNEPTQFTLKGKEKYKTDVTSATVTFPGTYNPVTVEKLADGALRPQGNPLVVPDDGSLVTFTLRFTNSSDRTITLDAIQDTLPSGVTGIEGTATYTQEGGSPALLPAPVPKVVGGLTTLTWYPKPGFPVFAIAPGKYAEVAFQARMPTTLGENYVNQTVGKIGTVVIDTTPCTTTDREPATAWVAVRKFADLSIEKTAPAGTVIAGSTLTYTIVVRNTGPSNVTGVRVQDEFPDDFFVSGNWSVSYTGGASGTDTGSGDIDALINLPKNSSATFVVTGLVNPATAAESISNTGYLTAPSGVQDDPSDNSSNVTRDVDRKGNLSIEKTTQGLIDGVLIAGQSYSYKLVVSNAGTSTAVGASVTDLFPAQFLNPTISATSTSGSATIDAASIGMGQLNATVTIPTGDSVTFTITGVLASDTAITSIANTATVIRPDNFTDTAPGNNTDSVTDGVDRKGNLSIEKTTQGLIDGVLIAGQSYSYKLVVSNAGTSTAVGASVTDLFPIQFLNPTISATSTSGSATIDAASIGMGKLNATVTIPTGDSVTFTITGVLAADTAIDSIANTATVIRPDNFTDTAPGNNTDSVTDDVDRKGNLSIEKTTQGLIDGVLIAGQSYSYKLVVSNAGTSTAVGASVTDLFPAQFLNPTISATSTSGSATIDAASIGMGKLNATVTIPTGDSVTFTITGVLAADTAITAIANTATVIRPDNFTDTTPGNNTDSVTDGVDRKGNLSIDKTTQGLIDGVLIAGQSYSYKLVVSNAGTSTAVGASVTDLFPAQFLNPTISATSTSGSATIDAASIGMGKLNATVTIPTGDSVTFTITGVLASDTAITSIANTATVIRPDNFTDTAPGNNTDSVTDDVDRKGNLSIDKTTQGLIDGVLVAGQSYSYKLVVSNTGTSTAVGASVTDLFPLQFLNPTISATSTSGSATIDAASVGMGKLNATVTIPTGDSVTFTITGVLASDTAITSIANTATVIRPDNFTDTIPGNNTDSVTDSTRRLADLSITKTPTGLTYTPGGTITYQIVVTNLGPVGIPGTTVTDTLPTGTSFQSAAPLGSFVVSSGTVTFTVGALAPTDSQSFTLTILVPSDQTGDVKNTATVNIPAGFEDPNPGNNTATSTFFEPQPPQSVDGGLVIGTDDGCNGPLPTRVRVINALADGEEIILGGFVPYAGWRGSVRVATGDLNGDGIDEIVTAPGRGFPGQVRVFDSQTGIEIQSYRFFPFGPAYRGGLEIAVGKLNTDAFGDIIVGQSSGAGMVRGFRGTGTETVLTTPSFSYRGIPLPYSGGVQLTAADFGSYVGSTWTPGVLDGISEIAVGSNVGIRAQVRVVDVSTPTLPRTVRTILPFAATFRGGVTLATGQYDSDGVPDLLVGSGVGGQSRLEVWSLMGGLPAKIAAFAGMGKPNASLYTAALDLNGDGVVDDIYGVQGRNGSGGTRGVRDYVVGSAGTATQLTLTNDSNYLPPLRIAPLRLTNGLLGRRRST